MWSDYVDDRRRPATVVTTTKWTQPAYATEPVATTAYATQAEVVVGAHPSGGSLHTVNVV